ncbi:hypothetical protein [Halodesulfovibrio sp.]|jgi:hypothetical protein|uniref:hypothetical protein n=1 Tax=Halodesulfovibrio sp. TaxID=1912772 RepID=UPI0025EA7CAC|nr:hypothetical protein [Halodesulfovibrio sp.]MCT4533877.1 hypothetical protein [Halodesulfovibrio sp.]
MMIYKYLLIISVCCMLLMGCRETLPEGECSRLVHSVVLPVEQEKIEVWSEEVLSDGVIVRADTAIFWVDNERRIFTLNKRAVDITDTRSELPFVTPQLLAHINRNLVSIGKRRLNAQGSWKYFKWNKAQ